MTTSNDAHGSDLALVRRKGAGLRTAWACIGWQVRSTKCACECAVRFSRLAQCHDSRCGLIPENFGIGSSNEATATLGSFPLGGAWYRVRVLVWRETGAFQASQAPSSWCAERPNAG